jgi:hypothetical protein
MGRFVATLFRMRAWFTEPLPLPWTPLDVLATGYFDTITEAAAAREALAKQLRGDQ